MRLLLPGLLAALVAVPFLAPGSARAQELDCNVKVNYTKLGGSDYTFLDEFEQRVDEYVNDRRWTQDRFEEFERIACNVSINFEEALSLTSFRASLIVASRRPVYGTAPTVPVTQFKDDDWQFNYSQGTPLNMDPERYDPITSVLDFYVNLILAYDYDTFSEFGGTPHLERARTIAEKAQAQNAAGWSKVGSERGRLDLVTQLLDPAFKPLRTAYFRYHFEALDRFTQEPEAARETVFSLLQELNELYEMQGRSYALDLFFNTKYSELASVFQGSRMSTPAYSLLSVLDSAHMTEYNRLVEQ